MAVSDIGSGATLALGTSSKTWEIRSMAWSGMERSEAESTHLTSAQRTFVAGDIPSLGTLTITHNLDVDEDPFDMLSLVAETFTITFETPIGGSGGATWAGSGFIRSLDPVEIGIEEMLVGAFTIRLTGDLTSANAT